MEYLLLILGLSLLLFSGKYLVKASVALSFHFHLTKLAVGMTVVAFGTSAPELLVSVQAAVHGHQDISVYNVVGSNISNIALVLALAAIIRPIAVKPMSLWFDWPFMMLATVLFYLFVLNLELQRFEGIIFIILLIAFIAFSMKLSRKKLPPEERVKVPKPEYSLIVAIPLVLISMLGLAFGADLLVDNAALIAAGIGISERLISVSLVAVGTSLPELSTSLIASHRKEDDISIGNIIGSNIFNLLSVLGITSIIRPVGINPLLLSFDIFWLLGISLLLYVLIMITRRMKRRLDLPKGSLLLVIYIMYIYFIFIR